MATIEVTTDAELYKFQHHAGYFLTGDQGILKKNGLYDYPSSYNDPSSQERLLNCIKKISNKPLTLHDFKQHLISNIEYTRKKVAEKEKEIADYKDELLSKIDVLDSVKNAVNFEEAFKIIINL